MWIRISNLVILPQVAVELVRLAVEQGGPKNWRKSSLNGNPWRPKEWVKAKVCVIVHWGMSVALTIEWIVVCVVCKPQCM